MENGQFRVLPRRTAHLLLSVTMTVGLTTLPVQAQTVSPEDSWNPPRTAWDVPDLQGIWTNATLTPVERPEDLGAQEQLTDEEAVELEVQSAENRKASDRFIPGVVGAYNQFWMDQGTTVVGNRHTSLVVDPPNGRMPAMTVEAEKRAAARRDYRREHPADSWEDRGLNDRCMFTTGLPIVPSAYNNNVQFFQTPDHVAMLIEMTHTLRVILLDGRSPSNLSQFVGVSRGHWEGDTLVVETTNFHRLTSLRGSTSNARLLERFTRVGPERP